MKTQSLISKHISLARGSFLHALNYALLHTNDEEIRLIIGNLEALLLQTQILQLNLPWLTHESARAVRYEMSVRELEQYQTQAVRLGLTEMTPRTYISPESSGGEPAGDRETEISTPTPAV